MSQLTLEVQRGKDRAPSAPPNQQSLPLSGQLAVALRNPSPEEAAAVQQQDPAVAAAPAPEHHSQKKMS